MLTVTVEAQAWLDGCIAGCDTRNCENKAVGVIEFGTADFRIRSARCAGDMDAPVGAGDPPVERVPSAVLR